MAVSFNAGSAKISVSRARVKPALFIGNGLVVCHLTNGFTDPNNISQAFTATGQVGVTGPASEVKAHTVNFIQFQKMRDFSFVYSTGVFVAPERILISPAFTPNPALDSETSVTPFTSGDAVILNAGQSINVMGDHPASKAPTSLTHRKDGRTAMITSINDSREFWTSFVVRSPSGAGAPIQYLAHFHWELNYRFSLEWELTDMGDMRVKALISTSTINFDDPVPGPPTAGEIARMLANPLPPQANDVMRAAVAAAVLGGLPNRQDLAF
jgi:hypothetical protein